MARLGALRETIVEGSPDDARLGLLGVAKAAGLMHQYVWPLSRDETAVRFMVEEMPS